jgi:hypothetical protein
MGRWQLRFVLSCSVSSGSQRSHELRRLHETAMSGDIGHCFPPGKLSTEGPQARRGSRESGRSGSRPHPQVARYSAKGPRNFPQRHSGVIQSPRQISSMKPIGGIPGEITWSFPVDHISALRRATPRLATDCVPLAEP